MNNSGCFTALVKLMAVIMIATTLLVAFPVINVSAADNVIITLDPGHGGSDPGNQSALKFGGNNEDFDNWEMTMYAKARLEQYVGVTVYLTRDVFGEFVDLEPRVTTAKSYNSDAIISIHTNAVDNPSANGFEIWVPTDNYRPDIATASKKCADTVREKYIAEMGLTDRGLKSKDGSSTFPDGSAADSLSILRNGKKQGIPVVMLIETGFASNQVDYLKVFQSDVTRMRAGYAIADGIAAYYNLSPKAGADLSMPAAPDIVIPEAPKNYNFYNSVDHVNGKGPNGAPNFAGIGGNHNSGPAVIDAIGSGVAINENKTLTVGGWLGVDGGTARFVYSVDGGETWKDATGGYDGEPLPGHYAGLSLKNATKLGMFDNSRSPIVADLSAYAGEFLDVTFAAVSAADNKTVIPFVTILNYMVPGEKQPEETTTEAEVTTTEPETTVTEPEATVTEPEVTTAEPEVTTVEPETTEADTTTVSTPDTDAVAKDGGCGSTVSGALAVAALVTAAGALCLARKKED